MSITTRFLNFKTLAAQRPASFARRQLRLERNVGGLKTKQKVIWTHLTSFFFELVNLELGEIGRPVGLVLVVVDDPAFESQPAVVAVNVEVQLGSENWNTTGEEFNRKDSHYL